MTGKKCPKTFFVYANEKIHRQITLLYRLFFDVSCFLIITKIVAVPIQVQSSSNSSPIGDWNYMGLELVIPMFKSYSAEKSSVSYKKITCSCDENKEREKRKKNTPPRNSRGIDGGVGILSSHKKTFPTLD